MDKKQPKYEIYSDKIETAVRELADKQGAVYCDDLEKATGFKKETLTRWLKINGFVKWAGHSSRRYTNAGWSRD